MADAHAAGAEDHDVADRAACGPQERAPGLGSTRRADDDDPVPGRDRVVPSGKDRLVAPDDRGDLGVLGDLGVAERNAEHVRRRVVVDVELAELHLALREHISLAGGRDAEDAADRIRGLELGRDDEVDVELALAPELDVLDARGADHGRRALGLAPGEHAGDEVDLVRATCTR